MKTIVVLLIVAIVGLALLLAGCRPRSPEQMMNRMFEDISRELNLSEAQKTRLLGIKTELLKKGQDMHQDREKIHEEMIQLIKSDRIDPDEVKAEARKKHARLEELFNVTIDRLAEFHATLSPEQKERLVELLEKHRKRRMPPWVH